MSSWNSAPSRKASWSGDMAASTDRSTASREDHRHSRVSPNSRHEDNLRSSSPYSMVEADITDPVFTPPTTNNTKVKDEDSNTFIDDSFDTASFRASHSGSHEGSMKRTHGSYARSQASSTSLRVPLSGFDDSNRAGPSNRHDMQSTRGSNIGPRNTFNHMAKQEYRGHRSPISSFESSSDADTALKHRVSRAKDGSYHARESYLSEPGFSANEDDHSVRSSVFTFPKEPKKSKWDQRDGVSVPASSVESIANDAVPKGWTKYTHADVCAGAGSMAGQFTGAGLGFRGINDGDEATEDSLYDPFYDFDAARRPNTPIQIVPDSLHMVDPTYRIPRWDSRTGTYEHARNRVSGSLSPSEDRSSYEHRRHGHDVFATHDQRDENSSLASPSLSLRSVSYSEHTSNNRWEANGGRRSRSRTTDRERCQNDWVPFGDEQRLSTRNPTKLNHQFNDAQAHRAEIKDELAYLHQLLSQQQASIEHLYQNGTSQDKVAPASHAIQTGSNGTAGANEIDFLRRCISNTSISQDDRAKALGVLSTFQRGVPSRTVPQLLGPVATYHRDGADPALARVELQMAVISRDLIKVKAYNKFQRMQQDSDRLARIEEKLSDPKAASDGRLMSVLEDTTRKVDKLSDRVSKLKEFSRDGTPRSTIKNEVQEIADQLSELRSHVRKDEEYRSVNVKHLSHKVAILQERLDDVSRAKKGSSIERIRGGEIDMWDRPASNGSTYSTLEVTPIQTRFVDDGWRCSPHTVSRAPSSRGEPQLSGWDYLLNDDCPPKGTDTPATQDTQWRVPEWGRKKHNKGDWNASVTESDVGWGSQVGSKSDAQSLAKNGWGSPVARHADVSSEHEEGRTQSPRTYLVGWH